jgi:hypothetical protein
MTGERWRSAATSVQQMRLWKAARYSSLTCRAPISERSERMNALFLNPCGAAYSSAPSRTRSGRERGDSTDRRHEKRVRAPFQSVSFGDSSESFHTPRLIMSLQIKSPKCFTAKVVSIVQDVTFWPRSPSAARRNPESSFLLSRGSPTEAYACPSVFAYLTNLAENCSTPHLLSM